MSLRDLFTLNSNLLRDPDRFGEEITLFNPATDPATETTIYGILEVISNDPLVHTQQGDEIVEQATLEIAASVTITPKHWFEARGGVWKINGLGGRDRDLQTINVQRLVAVSKKSARPRGS